MSIKGIKLVTVPVSDQDAAQQFYVERLGFEVSQDSRMGPMRWLEVAPQGSPVSFALLPSVLGVPVGGLKGVQLFSDDLDGDCERLRAAGVTVDGPNARPWGRDASFADPDGNGFVLMSAPGGQ
ncbi:VOC family protein [Micromonospora sp. AMSO31t]|uniref:VOC family protein n=1 Tax=Micromonospora sp. AMSO31t TaxID=2650566 RepID=UPI00124AFB8D|nr:VOC family protein [Micromonospora sp. AMSO31t]KAB1907086.1 VOC family protein [Micromonospora sp. AMSO31t]